MKKPLLIFVTLTVFLTIILAACGSGVSEQDCVDAGGTWLADYNECEDISEAACTELDGTYDPCASACRHEPEGTVCTQQCVLVCSFE